MLSQEHHCFTPGPARLTYGSCQRKHFGAYVFSQCVRPVIPVVTPVEPKKKKTNTLGITPMKVSDKGLQFQAEIQAYLREFPEGVSARKIWEKFKSWGGGEYSIFGIATLLAHMAQRLGTVEYSCKGSRVRMYKAAE